MSQNSNISDNNAQATNKASASVSPNTHFPKLSTQTTFWSQELLQERDILPTDDMEMKANLSKVQRLSCDRYTLGDNQNAFESMKELQVLCYHAKLTPYAEDYDTIEIKLPESLTCLALDIPATPAVTFTGKCNLRILILSAPLDDIYGYSLASTLGENLLQTITSVVIFKSGHSWYALKHLLEQLSQLAHIYIIDRDDADIDGFVECIDVTDEGVQAALRAEFETLVKDGVDEELYTHSQLTIDYLPAKFKTLMLYTPGKWTCPLESIPNTTVYPPLDLKLIGRCVNGSADALHGHSYWLDNGGCEQSEMLSGLSAPQKSKSYTLTRR